MLLKYPVQISDIKDFTEKLNFAFQTSEENFANILSKSVKEMGDKLKPSGAVATERVLTTSLNNTNRVIKIAKILDKKYF